MTLRVLAIGLDAADPKVIRKLVGEGRLPTFARMLAEGMWSDVASAYNYGSGSVWPTFYTGTSPEVHGRYAEWLWQPRSMSVTRINAEGLRPFWADFVDEGVRVGVLDVPYAPDVGFGDGFEIAEWGAHDIDKGHLRCWGLGVGEIVDSFPQHPFRPPLLSSHDPSDRSPLETMARQSLEGLVLRTDLLMRLIEQTSPEMVIAVYPELHHAGHDLWHTVEPEHELFAFDRFDTRDVRPDLSELYEAADHELGRLLAQVGSSVSVFLFTLHGMQAGPGVPTHMSQLLRTHGLATATSLRASARGERARYLLRAIKRGAPDWARDLYQKAIPQMSRIRLAQGTMVEVQDWARTEAFPLPVEWHGYARVNLSGREAKGIVPASSYEDVRTSIVEATKSLADHRGESLVRDLYLPGAGRDPLELPVPDVIIHWDQKAHADDLRMIDGSPAPAKTGLGRTGEHDMAAFCLTTGPIASAVPSRLDSRDLAGWLHKAINATR